MIEAKIIRKIVSNNKEFEIGDDVYFKLQRNGTIYHMTGKISGIDDDGFCINHIRLDGMCMSDALFVKFTEVQDGKCIRLIAECGNTQVSCVDGFFKVENIDGYERILEEWAKKHPVVTNADKYIEVIKNTFGGTKLDKDKVHQRVCLQLVGKEIDSNKCVSMCCSECLKWWDEEYKEPVKEN